VFDASAYVTQRGAGPIPGVSQLEDLFDAEAKTHGVISSSPPTKRELVGLVRAYKLDREAEAIAHMTRDDEVLERCEPELHELSLMIQREGTQTQQRNAIEIRNSLGSGRPIKDGRDPQTIFLKQSITGKTGDPNSMKALALAYLNEVTPTARPERHWIADEINDVRFRIKQTDELRERSQTTGVDQREREYLSNRAYLAALYAALKTHQEFLNRFFSS